MSGLPVDGATLGGIVAVVTAAVAAPCFTFLQYWAGREERKKQLELQALQIQGKADVTQLEEAKSRLSLLEKEVRFLRQEIEDCEAHRHELRLALIQAGIKL